MEREEGHMITQLYNDSRRVANRARATTQALTYAFIKNQCEWNSCHALVPPKLVRAALYTYHGFPQSSRWRARERHDIDIM